MASLFTHVTIPSSPTATAIVVSNIAPEATETTVLDFFRFCGEIAQFELVKVTDDANNESKKAFIQFEKEAAARTALLLSNTMILDRPIEIAFFFENLPPYVPTDEDDLLRADQAPPTITVPQEAKPKSNVVAEMIAQGYKVGEQIVQDARKFDETYGISVRFQQFLQNAKAKGIEVDQKYQLRAKGQQAIETATKKAQEIYQGLDSKYQVNQKLDAFATSSYSTVQDIDQKYQVKAKFDQVSATASQLSQQAMSSETAKKVNSLLHQLAESAMKTLEEAKDVLNAEIAKNKTPTAPAATTATDEVDPAAGASTADADVTAATELPPAYQEGSGAPADDTKVPPS